MILPFQVRLAGSRLVFVESDEVETSNFLRWVNCPNKKSQENVRMRECLGKIFYMTKRNIHPGQELYVFYGASYAEDKLKINMTEYWIS